MHIQIKEAVITGVKFADGKSGRRYKVDLIEIDHPSLRLSTLQNVEEMKIKLLTRVSVEADVTVNTYTIEGKTFTVFDAVNLKVVQVGQV
jgi:hypothetical protein